MAYVKTGGPAFPVCNSDEHHPGMDMRAYATIKIAAALASDSEFVPPKTADDYRACHNGPWGLSNGCYFAIRSNEKYEGQTYEIVTTYEDRLARLAVKQADAILMALEP